MRDVSGSTLARECAACGAKEGQYNLHDVTPDQERSTHNILAKLRDARQAFDASRRQQKPTILGWFDMGFSSRVRNLIGKQSIRVEPATAPGRRLP